MTDVTLDHVGVVTRDLVALAAHRSRRARSGGQCGCRSLAERAGIAHRRDSEVLIVDAAAGGGVAIRFVPGLPDEIGLV